MKSKMAVFQGEEEGTSKVILREYESPREFEKQDVTELRW